MYLSLPLTAYKFLAVIGVGDDLEFLAWGAVGLEEDRAREWLSSRRFVAL